MDGYSSLSCKSHRCVKTTKKRSHGKHNEKMFAANMLGVLLQSLSDV